MEVSFYQAECGDAAKISFIGTDGLCHHIMIDAGYERTFRYVLLDEIRKIIENEQKIDLWIISHIHDDHIGGIMKYIQSVRDGEISDIIDKWYYNSPRNFSNSYINKDSSSRPKSIYQGDALYYYLQAISKLPQFDYTSELMEQNIFGMKIVFLSPPPNKLEKLRKKYSINKFRAFERSELDSTSEAVKAREYDYNTRLEDFDLSTWKEDDSVENGSSISILTDFNNKRILWLADSHPTDVVNTLKSKGYSTLNKLNCDWVKVTHHGSKGNNSSELYDLLECSNYLLSVNGENKHYLPTKESLARIILNKNRNMAMKYSFYFTYDNYVLRSIFNIDGNGIFERYNFEIFYLSDDKKLTIKVN